MQKKTYNLSPTCNKAVNLNVDRSLLDVLSLIHKDWKNMVLEKTLEQLSLLSLMRIHIKIFPPSFLVSLERRNSQTIAPGNREAQVRKCPQGAMARRSQSPGVFV